MPFFLPGKRARRLSGGLENAVARDCLGNPISRSRGEVSRFTEAEDHFFDVAEI